MQAGRHAGLMSQQMPDGAILLDTEFGCSDGMQQCPVSLFDDGFVQILAMNIVAFLSASVFAGSASA